MNDDMSDMMKNLSSMLSSGNIPDNIKDMMKNFTGTNGSCPSDDSISDDETKKSDFSASDRAESTSSAGSR